MKVTDMLVCHHDTLRGMFNAMERVMEEAESVDVIVALAAVLGGVVRDHAGAETQMLFAPLDAMLRQRNHTGHFFSKHEEYFETLERVVRQPPGRETRSLMTSALGTLRHHLDVEEQVVIPAAEKTFDLEALENLGEAWLQRDKKMVILAGE
jgi:hemerythrin-like domain-containing protein